MSTASRVSQVERTVREIATLNQMFSTAVLHQAEAIEAIYNNAVEASHVSFAVALNRPGACFDKHAYSHVYA